MNIRTTLTLLAGLCALAMQAQSRPEWVDRKPSSMLYYTGTAAGPTAAAAKELALADLISEIEVTVEANSLMKSVDINDSYTSDFRKEVRTKAAAELEGHELVDTWTDGELHYAYYQLDKQEWSETMARRITGAKTLAAEYLRRGKAAEADGDLGTAMSLMTEGLAAIEPYASRQLTVDLKGRQADVAIELFSALSSMLSDVTISVNPEGLEARPFSSDVTTANIGVSKGPVPVRGIGVSASFTTGSGDVTIKGPTDSYGLTTMTVTNVSSKIPYQFITLTLDPDIPAKFSTAYMKEIARRIRAAIPSVKVPVSLQESGLRAMLVTDDADISGLLQAISGHLNGTYFDIVTNRDDADVVISVSSSFHTGTVVKGELYDLVETFMSCNLTIRDVRSNTIVGNFGLNDVRSAAPVGSSVTKARATAQREMFKRLRPMIDGNLRRAHFSPRVTSGSGNSDVSDDYAPDFSRPDID